MNKKYMKKASYVFVFICIMLLSTFGCSTKDSGANSTANSNDTSKTQKENSSKGENTIKSSNISDLIKTPDKIMYYNKGKVITIDKNSEKFANIIKLVKERTVSADDFYKTAINNNIIDEQKKNNNVLEFIYTDKVSVTWTVEKDNKVDNKLEYNSIVLPLDGEYSKMAIFTPIATGPVGPLKDSKDILDYINK